ncbi:hypothetical protein D777_01058 [Marinobacter nitratireducens]|uniref:Uncharacterized protein n=1 Tax=Marinobacter nitratireducens TaxID=1137280 RepID=A0A072N3W8_9GAMM|nr:hypothetical protein D777_01058 [Marinobacter nitratireducens]
MLSRCSMVPPIESVSDIFIRILVFFYPISPSATLILINI